MTVSTKTMWMVWSKTWVMCYRGDTEHHAWTRARACERASERGWVPDNWRCDPITVEVDYSRDQSLRYENIG